MNKNRLFSVMVLISFVVLVPLVTSHAFFDSYLIKFWIAQFGGACLLILLCYRALFKNEALHVNKVFWLLLLYLAVNFVSWLDIPVPYRYSALLTFIFLFFYCILCFLVSQLLKEEKARNTAVLLWILTTVVICVYGIYQFRHKERVIGTLGNENFLASHIGISIPVCVSFLCAIATPILRKRQFMKGLAIISAGTIFLFLFFWALYITHSRGAWLGLLSAFSSFAIILWAPKGKRLLITAVLLILLIVMLALPFCVQFVLGQFQGDVRPSIWQGTISMIAEKPLLGWGKGAYFIFYPKYRAQEYWLTRSPTDLTVHAHNEFLQITAETGLIGITIFLVFIFVVVRQVIKEADKMPLENRFFFTGIISGIFGLLAHNLVCNNMQMPSSAIFFWFMTGIAITALPAKSLAFKMGKNTRYLIFLALTLFMAIIILQTGVKPVISQYYFREGWKFRESENWDKAIEKYEKGIKWYPWDPEMYYRLAYAYTMNKQFDKAIEKYKDVIRLAPLYGSVQRNMGMVYVKMADKKNAVKYLLQALYVNEYDTRARLCLTEAR